MKDTNHGDNLKQPIDSYQEVLREYDSLSQQPILSEIGAKRLERILEMACHDPKLSLLLNEIDEAIFWKQGFDDEQPLQNEVARVLELIDGDIPLYKTVFERAKLNLAAYEPLLKEYYQLLQIETLSETEAARMGQILDAAYEDELLTVLLDTVNEIVLIPQKTQSDNRGMSFWNNAIEVVGKTLHEVSNAIEKSVHGTVETVSHVCSHVESMSEDVGKTIHKASEVAEQVSEVAERALDDLDKGVYETTEGVAQLTQFAQLRPSPQYDLRGANFGGGMSGKIEGDQIGGVILDCDSVTLD